MLRKLRLPPTELEGLWGTVLWRKARPTSTATRRANAKNSPKRRATISLNSKCWRSPKSGEHGGIRREGQTLGRLFFCRPQPMGSNINPVMSCIAQTSAVDRQTLTRGTLIGRALHNKICLRHPGYKLAGVPGTAAPSYCHRPKLSGAHGFDFVGGAQKGPEELKDAAGP